MKIILLNFEFPPIGGGGANATLQLLKQYAGRENMRIDVLTSGTNRGIIRESLADNVTIYKIGINKKNLHYWRKTEVLEWLIKAGSYYRRLLRENKYDLVHAFFGFPTGWLCYKTKNLLPYIISLRGSDVPGGNVRLQLDYKILAPVFKAIWKKASVLITPSQGLKERALKFLPAVSIEVIPNGVDAEVFHPAEQKQDDEVLRLIAVGRLSPTKRFELLIDAVDILIRQNYKIILKIVGAGSEEGLLRKKVADYKIENFIDLTGRIEPGKMPDLYRNSDIFVSTSMQEGMSNAMLEAMASALPIVTTECEGVAELISNNGIVVKNADAREIADCLKQLADDRRKLRQMSLASEKQALVYSWDSAAGKYIELYKRILS